MDQDERIEQLKAEVRRLNGGEDPPSFGLESMPKEIAEQFLERIIAVETGRDNQRVSPLSGDGTAWHVAIPRKQSEH